MWVGNEQENAPPLAQSEDALTLTIRTPAKFGKDGLQTRTNDKLPVMVRNWPKYWAHSTMYVCI